MEDTVPKRASVDVEPMKTAGTQYLLERAYRESGPRQYIREAVRNALEAQATRIELGPEWQAVEGKQIYRLMIADNGCGMDAENIIKFLNTFGGGGKPIGDAHENYGIGVKSSTLPWNHRGLVVISYTKGDPEGVMVWLQRNPNTGEYGAHKFETEGGEFNTVVAPFDDADEGIDWRKVKPDWLTEHGTVLVFLGNTGTEDTFLGKDGDEDVKGISAYLNKRFWAFPEGVRVHVQELRSTKRAEWPRSYAEAASGSQPRKGKTDRRWNRRRIRGARYFAEYPKTLADGGKLGSTESVKLSDGTVIDCYLWAGKRPKVHSYAQMNGYLAALYDDELYDVQKHAAHFRRFGITQAALRSNVTLIVCPPALEKGVGVYPDTARASLKIMGSKDAGRPLPWAEWGEEFARNMPEGLKKAIIASTGSSSGSLTDKKWRKRFIERFGKRWRDIKRVVDPKGKTTVDPNEPNGSTAKKTKKPKSKRSGRGGGKGAAAGAPGRGANTGPKKATEKNVTAGLPEFKWENSEDDVAPGAAAIWQKVHPGFTNGVVLLNREFPAFVEVIKHWQSHYPDVMADQVRDVVETVYGHAMVARIAHSETLCKDKRWGRERVESELRSPEALTMAALGLFSEDSLIAQRLGALLGKGKAA